MTKQCKANDPICIWVVGCSTGEEVYSIAICLLEFLTNQEINIPIQIFARDFNEVAIEKARTGVFKLHQVAEISPERLKRFFVHVDGGYQISKLVRELCIFTRQNLISDPPFFQLDLITCLNVLIYLGSTARQKLLPIFHYSLRPTGFLMLGISELLNKFTGLFNVVDKKYKIYGCKIAYTWLAIEPITSNYLVETTQFPLLISNNVWNDVEIHKEADRIL
ncbi:CheR family methyltransferase [Trichormus azollae]|uniref:CheR family methyltransferase n=1 Tax=Trichormus azollae TaxID=1164 RepID=UPI00325F324A